MSYPTLFYKLGGPHKCKQGTFQYIAIGDDEGAQNALENGWFKTLTEALEAKSVGSAKKILEKTVEIQKEVLTDPEFDGLTRGELERHAIDLGIKRTNLMKDSTLIAKIQEKVKKKKAKK